MIRPYERRPVTAPDNSMGSPVGMPAPERLLTVLEQLEMSVRKTDAVLAAAQEIPRFEVETAIDTTGTQTVLSVFPKTTNIVLVQQVMCFVPTGASGLLVLGPVQIPVGPGTTSLQLFLPLNTDDVRQIQSTLAGTLSLTVMGSIKPRTMLLR